MTGELIKAVKIMVLQHMNVWFINTILFVHRMIKSILIPLSDGVGNFSINFENYLLCSYRSLKETVKSYKPKAMDRYIAERLYK
jgi:hypothetical protein